MIVIFHDDATALGSGNGEKYYAKGVIIKLLHENVFIIVIFHHNATMLGNGDEEKYYAEGVFSKLCKKNVYITTS